MTWIPGNLMLRASIIAASIGVALATTWGGCQIHDRKVASRVIEKSKSEAHKDVAIGKEALSRSLAGTGGMRSPYRRD